MKIQIEMINFVISDKKYLVTYGEVRGNTMVKVYVNTKNGVDKVDLEEKLKIIKKYEIKALPKKFKKYIAKRHLVEYIKKQYIEERRIARLSENSKLLKVLGGTEKAIESLTLEDKRRVYDYIVDMVEREINLGLRKPLHVTI